MRCEYDRAGQCARLIVGDGTVPAFDAGHIILAIFIIALLDKLFRQFCIWFIPICSLRSTRLQIIIARYFAMVAGIVMTDLIIDQNHDLRRTGDAAWEAVQQLGQLLSGIGWLLFGI